MIKDEEHYVKFYENVLILNDRRNWNINQPEDYKLIPLTQGKLSKVDNEDFGEINKLLWHLNSSGYIYNRKVGYLHRFIIDVPKGMLVDHINMDKLDNRKSNLRLCTHQENNCNRKAVGGTSEYKGVSWDKESKKWRAQISYNNKRVSIGRYNTEDEAGLAYNKKATELFGEFARLNNIKNG